MRRSDELAVNARDDGSFAIGGIPIGSRLLIGSSGFPNRQIMLQAIEASEAEIITVSIRRISLEGYAESMVDLLSDKLRLLPNTAGCTTVRDAILTAQLGREALDTNWIKLELIGDRETLHPDVGALIDAADVLVRDGFIVLPYCSDDPVICRRLADLGCAAVMPLGAPIGSGMGILNPYNIELICARSEVPVILDAGIGTASDAVRAMELGCAAVLVNSAIAKADDPVRMAHAMRRAVIAGHDARRAGRIPERHYADPSSPQLGLIGT